MDSSTYTTNNETINFFKLWRIFIELLRDVLWKIVTKEIPAHDLVSRISVYLGTVSRKQQLHHRLQELCGLPQGRHPARNDCDISVLYSIITNICSLPRPAQGWGAVPSDGDTSISDDIERIRQGRNSISHIKTCSLPDEEFNKRVKQLQVMVARLDNKLQSNFTEGLKTIMSDEMDSVSIQKWASIFAQQREFDDRLDELELKVVELEKKHKEVDQRDKEAEVKFRRYIVEKYQKELSYVTMVEGFEEVSALHIITPLIIREDCEKWLSSSKVERAGTFHGKAPKREPFKTLKDVFYKNGELQREIYLLGEPGIGKSTFCHRIVNMWCNLQESEPTSDDEKIICNFDFVFLVRCRFSNGSESVLEMIQQQICPLEDHKLVEEVFKCRPEKCLVIIDGLDEWNQEAQDAQRGVGPRGLPKVTDIGRCIILTTSRPWRVEMLEQSLLTCRVLEIVGLDDKDVEHLSREVMAVLGVKSELADATFTKFKTEIAERELKDLVKIPLLLIAMLNMWYKGKQVIGNSMADIYCGLIESVINNPREGIASAVNISLEREQLPQILAEKEKCRKYGYWIQILAKLSFDTLVCEEKEKSLVFSKNELKGQIDEDDLKVCFQLGLLSQSKTSSKTRERKVTVSFLHKSVQEFLGALHFSDQKFDQCFGRFCNNVKTLEQIHDTKLLIVFLSGIAPEKGRMVLDHITKLAAESQETSEYRSSITNQNGLHPDFNRNRTRVMYVELIQSTVLQCFLESRRCQEMVIGDVMKLEGSYRVEDVVLNRFTPLQRMQILCSQGKTIKSLVINDDINKSEFDVFQVLAEMPELEKLYICTSAMAASENMKLICNSIASCKQMKAFGINVIGKFVLSVTDYDVMSETLKKMCCLQLLHLRNLDFSKISKVEFPPQLQTLSLRAVTLSRGTVFPEACVSLSLEYTIFGGVSRKTSKIPRTVYKQTYASEKVVPHLPPNLTSLYTLEVSLSARHLHQWLGSGSSSLRMLTFLPVSYVRIAGGMNLSRHKSLHTLHLRFIDLKEGIVLSTEAPLKLIILEKVTISDTILRLFLCSLRHHKMLTVELRHIKTEKETQKFLKKTYNMTCLEQDCLVLKLPMTPDKNGESRTA